MRGKEANWIVRFEWKLGGKSTEIGSNQLPQLLLSKETALCSSNPFVVPSIQDHFYHFKVDIEFTPPTSVNHIFVKLLDLKYWRAHKPLIVELHAKLIEVLRTYSSALLFPFSTFVNSIFLI